MGDASLGRILHIEVMNTSVSAGSSLVFFVNYLPKVINGQSNVAKLDHITFSYIIIGDEFDGDSQVAKSSYIFARNGDLAGYQANIDFANTAYQTRKGPFNWDETT